MRKLNIGIVLIGLLSVSANTSSAEQLTMPAASKGAIAKLAYDQPEKEKNTINKTPLFHSKVSCPKDIGTTIRTLNNDGDSAYSSKFISDFYPQLLAKGYKKSDAILDVMAGYGAELNSLLKLGAINIYVNELNASNMYCLNKYSHGLIKENKADIQYINGNIVSNEVISKLPNDHFKLVFAINGIQFLSYAEFLAFSKAMYTKMSNKSLIILAYENPYLKEQTKMVQDIGNKWATLGRNADDINNLVKEAFAKYSFPRMIERHCMYSKFDNTNIHMKDKEKVFSIGSCSLPTNNQNGYTTLYLPTTVSGVMENNGFYLVTQNIEKNKFGTIVQMFEKITVADSYKKTS